MSESLNYSKANMAIAFRTAIVAIVLLSLVWSFLTGPGFYGPGPAATVGFLTVVCLVTPLGAVLVFSMAAFVLKKWQRLSVRNLVLVILPSVFFLAVAPAAITVFYAWDYSFQNPTTWMFMKRLTIMGGILLTALIVPFARVWFRIAEQESANALSSLDA